MLQKFSLRSYVDKYRIVVSPPLNQAPIELAEKEFGAVDRAALQEAEMKVGDWLSPWKAAVQL